MERLAVSCRRFVIEENCSVSIAAATEEELVEAAIEHAGATHSLEDTPALRQFIRVHIVCGEA